MHVIHCSWLTIWKMRESKNYFSSLVCGNVKSWGFTKKWRASKRNYCLRTELFLFLLEELVSVDKVYDSQTFHGITKKILTTRNLSCNTSHKGIVGMQKNFAAFDTLHHQKWTSHFLKSYNVWKRARYPPLISRQPGW